MDISLLFKNGYPAGDIFMLGPDLDSAHPLETAVLISLFTDRRAEIDDDPTDADRRGWWGDTFLPVTADRIGSRLWLLRRQKETQQIVNLAKFYADEALQWLVDDAVAESIIVTAEIVRKGVLGLSIEINKPDGAQEFNYQYAWG